MRRVVYYDSTGNRTFVFYTNNIEITAEDVAELYHNRWKVELFFKWMKQHLHIKEFFGTTENAVKIQIYTAVIAYCLVAIAERELNADMEIYDVLRILGISLLDKTPIVDLLTKKTRYAMLVKTHDSQLISEIGELTNCKQMKMLMNFRGH